MAIDIVARALAVSGKQNLFNYYTKTESDERYVAKVTNTNSTRMVYTIEPNSSTQSTRFVSTALLNSSIVQRDDNGNVKVASPINDTDATNKKYVDDQIAAAHTTVVANPTLAGTEAELSGLQVGETKYKMPAEVYVGNTSPSNTDAVLWVDVASEPSGGGGSSGSGKLYRHDVDIYDGISSGIHVNVYSSSIDLIDNFEKVHKYITKGMTGHMYYGDGLFTITHVNPIALGISYVRIESDDIIGVVDYAYLLWEDAKYHDIVLEV